jgi:hypothetical protein
MLSEHGLHIFVISHNRSAMLNRCIRGLRRQSVPLNIVVRDHGSTDEETLRTLDSLQRSGITVQHRAPITHPDELNHVAETVADFLGDVPEVPYAVTDCDIDLSATDPQAVMVYEWLLERYPDVECVGPMLTIRDIPQHYPLRNRALRGHIEQFWGRVPTVDDTPYGLVASQSATIDTTFALHRPGTPFRRLRPGRRVYHPFEARHLDWYIGADDFAVRQGAATIGHWSNAAWLVQERDHPPVDATYYVVERAAPERLVIERLRASDPVPPRVRRARWGRNG